jgi:signal transduction histidine kinase
MLATLAHEFRTPLSVMQVSLELLDDVDAHTPDEVVQLVRRLRRSVGWLSGMVDNLEIWSAIETGHLEVKLAPVPVTGCVESALTLVQPLLDHRRQDARIIGLASSTMVAGDSRLLCHVLVNLLTNASQYCEPSGKIDVIVSQVSGGVVIRISDDGPGIAENEQEFIFDRYARGSAADRHTRGLGLGLHIVKTLVELHGGEVGVDSAPTQGASFWIRLPAPDTAGASPDDQILRRIEDA